MAYRASEEDYGHGYGGGLGGEGGAITSQINRGTDQIREDLARGGEAVRDANRNYFQNIGDALEKGVSGYEHGQDIAYKKQAQAREAQRFNTEEEAAKQNKEKNQMEIEAMRRKGLSEEAQQEFLNRTDQASGKTNQERVFEQPFQQFELNKKTGEQNIAASKAGVSNEGQRLGMDLRGEQRQIASAKLQRENEALAAHVGSQIMGTPTEQMDQVASQIMAQTPPEKQAAVFKAIGDARAQKFSQTLAENSTPQGQLKVQLHQQAYHALSDANELRGKLKTFEQNRTSGGIDVGLGEIPLGLRNDVADNALQEMASIISKDGTPQSQELAKKLVSPYRMDSQVITEAKAYINAKERETRDFTTRAAGFFPAGEKDEFQKSLMHLTQGIGGDKNRPTAKGLTPGQGQAFLTGGQVEPQGQPQIQPAMLQQQPSTQGFHMPQQPMQPPQGQPQGVPPPQQPAPQVSPLRARFGRNQ